jgi:hypothetical protein
MRTEILSLQVKAIFLFMEGKPDGASNILLLTSQLLTLSTHARSMLNLNIALNYLIITPVRICHCDTTRLSQSKFWLRDVKFLIKLLIWVGANMLYCPSYANYQACLCLVISMIRILNVVLNIKSVPMKPTYPCHG